MIVSTDVINSPLAALIDQSSIELLGNKVKLTAFYDNEAGYSHQLVQLILNGQF
jgi:glyceraldehyde 3-phosphate dehydrogenase